MEFEHAGWRCVRVIGSQLGRRGSARRHYGWNILDPKTGELIETLVPNAQGGVPTLQVRIRAEQLRKLANLNALDR